MPAYNAQATLKETYDNIPKEFVDDIILVDDCSTDNTVEIAKSLGIKTITHDKNLVDFFQKRVVVIEDGVIKEDRIGGMFNA